MGLTEVLTEYEADRFMTESGWPCLFVAHDPSLEKYDLGIPQINMLNVKFNSNFVPEQNFSSLLTLVVLKKVL